MALKLARYDDGRPASSLHALDLLPCLPFLSPLCYLLSSSSIQDQVMAGPFLFSNDSALLLPVFSCFPLPLPPILLLPQPSPLFIHIYTVLLSHSSTYSSVSSAYKSQSYHHHEKHYTQITTPSTTNPIPSTLHGSKLTFQTIQRPVMNTSSSVLQHHIEQLWLHILLDVVFQYRRAATSTTH